jgi:hypothetical protein
MPGGRDGEIRCLLNMVVVDGDVRANGRCMMVHGPDTDIRRGAVEGWGYPESEGTHGDGPLFVDSQDLDTDI